jgi:endonuclease/exonuclease/phosphatase family metal-dependent hydrolase
MMQRARPGLALRAVACAAGCALALAAAADTTLTVMSFNIWGGGANEGKPVDATVAAIRAAGADVVGVQETRVEGDPCTADDCPPAGPSAAGAIATALGFHYYDQTQHNVALWANAILSRYPIGAATAHDLGVAIDVDGRTVYAYNVHLDDSPYQPYQLLGIEYGAAPFVRTVRAAVGYARATRAPALRLLFEDLAAARDADAAFVFGDFNEPSHRDWTRAAAAAGLHPLAVPYPTALALERKGFVDALRAAFPDEVARPAWTWPTRLEPNWAREPHDRIDYVLARGHGLIVQSAAIVGEQAPEADIVVTPWPSDHRAVAVTVRF